MPKIIEVKKNVLAKNDEIAARLRQTFAKAGVTVLNLVSSPGAGKTALLVKTLTDLKERFRMGVIEGDQRTANDAERIAATGAPVVQINTLSACHLDASMVETALPEVDLHGLDFLFIENVGNLVCPAGYDLGEAMKVVVMSTTEGEDKPVKYPKMFRVSSAVVLTKTDLLPHLDFDADAAMACARSVNPALVPFRLSVKSGEGLAQWYDWLAALRR
ncbi:MAG: hydrogenase nickel incorporation protein HypB [Nitrospinae bacterium]|nr:hydrogenase nickel incorporation protein HypB [Nitrospinota bacterium]